MTCLSYVHLNMAVKTLECTHFGLWNLVSLEIAILSEIMKGLDYRTLLPIDFIINTYSCCFYFKLGKISTDLLKILWIIDSVPKIVLLTKF